MFTRCDNKFSSLLSDITINSNDPNVTKNYMTGGNSIILPDYVIWSYICAKLNHNCCSDV